MAESAPITTARCHLLEMPPELRNRIYRFALVQHSQIFVCDDGYDGLKTPALLRVCRQIRAEARSIYYIENKFSIEVPDPDPAVALHFHQQAEGLWSNYEVGNNFAEGFEYELRFWNCWSWKNSGWSSTTRIRSPCSQTAAIGPRTIPLSGATVRMFELVIEMQRCRWSTVSAALEVFKEALEDQAGDRWWWDD
ncbi:hypothetical protein CLAFUW4_09360 [Fulvia fulva]|uniref:2EXR domain-containing protein n=1 Tax=Passalora fulva TaxID=5499 RepID=A0A9Q8UU25_PASFU|nr:uncharacterized protein CLAFUR5_09459 [Fulvia fulva]KAK4613882.1 hypothetical protein CLAFUR4_09366 [Fulvia fulva]KAK4614979.1 hypothetical protein CLAFUR0_09357 [Fulvia fulva]UJO22377.1 hypothetical protein CLAFUR5_09459 [Fulvia fulva]WPV19887.1 hypothetical protein CLAFUW4_09360 [Fulvia fulva]WPV35066.1 hypothetical protein CLAFUW7_09361 [Fulvia fulva]